MIIKTEISSFDEFRPWSGGKDTLDELTYEQQQRLFEYAEELFPDGCTDTELNDWLWFDRDSIYEYLGIDDRGNEIGSREWASAILTDYADDYSNISQFGNIYNLITTYLDEEYCDDDYDDEDNLKNSFDRFVFENWREFATHQLSAWHSDIELDDIREWVLEQYDDEEHIPDIDDVEEEFAKFAAELIEPEQS